MPRLATPLDFMRGTEAMKLALVAAATMAVTAFQPVDDTVKVGSHPKYVFSNPMVNNLGVKSLADLEGRPVLVEFWGTH
jgi:hypothetical protein